MSRKAILSVSFDIEQMCANLLWRATDPQTGANLLEATGRYAGAVHFMHGDQVFVEVRGSGPSASYLNSRIVAAHLITVPHSTAQRVSAPSPFSNEIAVVEIPGWTPTQMIDVPAEGRRVSLQQSAAALPVIQKDGRWELSLLLSVAISTAKDGVSSEIVRVFAFDPESEVGDGTDPNRQ